MVLQMTDLKSKAHSGTASSTINALKRHLMPVHSLTALVPKSDAVPTTHEGIQTGGNTCFLLSWRTTCLCKLPLPAVSCTSGTGLNQTSEARHQADTELNSPQNH